MTVIAYDGRTVAADKLAISSGLCRTTTKLFRIRDEVVTINGDAAFGMLLVAWYDDGANPTDYPKCDHDDVPANLTVFGWRKPVKQYEYGGVPVVFEDSIFATGCGRDFALAAMEMGADAIRAVEIACKYEASCGMGIDHFNLEQIAAKAA